MIKKVIGGLGVTQFILGAFGVVGAIDTDSSVVPSAVMFVASLILLAIWRAMDEVKIHDYTTSSESTNRASILPSNSK